MLPNKVSMMGDVVDSYCQRKGIALTTNDRRQAIDFGVGKWKGRTLAGTAAKAGIKHVINGKH